MRISNDPDISQHINTPTLDVITYFPYFALLMVVIVVIAIFYTRWIKRQLKEALQHNPKDKELLRAMKIANFREVVSYAMLVIIGVGNYFLTHIDSFLP